MLYTFFILAGCPTSSGPGVEILAEGSGYTEGDEGSCDDLTPTVVASAAETEALWPGEVEGPSSALPDEVAYEGHTVFFAQTHHCGGDTELRVTDVTQGDDLLTVTLAAGYAEPGTHTDDVVNPFLLGSVEGRWRLEFNYDGHVGVFD